MFICGKHNSCCDHKYWDRVEDVEQEAKECGHLIEVEPVRHGRWKITEDEFYMGLTICRCSACNEEYYFEDITDIESLNYRYCPNCGCKMDGGADNA